MNYKGIRYLLVGGHALSFYGVCRPTSDLDFSVASDLEAASHLTQAVREFGFGQAAVDPRVFAQKKVILQLELNPHRIDIMNHIDGISFEQTWPGRIEREVSGVPITIMGRKDLVINKLSSGREKDLSDLMLLEKASLTEKER